MKKRLLALLLCLATFFSILPLNNVVFDATEEEQTSTEYTNYGAAIGGTARFDIENSINFLVFSDPKSFDYDADWNDDANWLYYTDVEEIFDFEEDHLFSVVGYYYDEETTALWYKLKPAPGYEMPERMENAQWAFQNFTEEYEYEGWEENSPNMLLVTPGGKNFVFNADGNPVTQAEIGLYETLTLSCETTLVGNPTFQWQIRIGDEWVEILGRDSAELPVNYSLLAMAADETNTAQLRCVTKAGSKTVEGEPISITVDTNFDYDSYVHPEPEPEPEPEVRLMSTRSTQGRVMPLAADDVCYVTVQYLFRNGQQAANSTVAEVPKGEVLTESIPIVFPHVLGYLPYLDDVRVDSINLQGDIFEENTLITVYYEPDEVPYTVDIYFQNIENDEYSFYDSTSYDGLTGSKVPLTTHTFPGMRELLHETPTIAADGSTHLEVYYDRLYYMTRVYLDGGYGIYSVYARYGADLQSHLTAPARPGYAFRGWDEYKVDSNADGVPDTGADGLQDIVYATVPAENLAYVALWVERPTVPVNVVFWGQDPNDEDAYSYLQTKQLGIAPGTELTYALSSTYICGVEEHVHNGDCKNVCGLTEHAHTEACYGNCTHKVHDELSCYTIQTPPKADTQTGDVATAFGDLKSKVTTPINGNVYRYRYDVREWFFTTSHYYNFFYVGGEWYYLDENDSTNNTTIQGVSIRIEKPSNNNSYTTAAATAIDHHDHTVECLDCLGHVHDATCYSGCVSHTHTTACQFTTFKGYDATLWTLSTKEGIQSTITVERDGSSVLNVYFDRTSFKMHFRKANTSTDIYLIEAKWGANIEEEFYAASDVAGYNSWSLKSNASNPWVNHIETMPAEERVYYSYTGSGSNIWIMTYYKQRLDNLNEYDVAFEVKLYRSSNTTVSDEEYIDIVGFNINKDKSTKTGSYTNGAKFYYDRKTDNVLEFHSGNDTVRTETHLYGYPLSEYASYTNPPLPDNVEKDSHDFKGWYLNPECTREADLSTMTMPAGNLALYAKWEPKYHDVRIVLEEKADGNYTAEDSVIWDGGVKLEKLSVLHGTIVFSGDQDKTPPIPDNGDYKFLGWFYDDDGVELMWDFEHHPVVKELVIYAKWSSEVLVPYTIYYKDKAGNEVAAPTTGSSLAGHSITVDAKVGNELYTSYQAGYFPETSSHSIELKLEDAEDGVEYTFVYNQTEPQPYWVHYVEKDNPSNELITAKTATTSYAIVTEKFVQIPGYTPDSLQKSLIITTNEAENHLYFYYSKNNEDGVWLIEHFAENKDYPGLYNELPSQQGIDKLGTTISASWPVDLSTDGFEFDYAVINGDTENRKTSLAEAKGEVTTAGLHIQVYYKRIKYPFKIVFINKDTGTNILETKIFTADDVKQPYGKNIYPSTIFGSEPFPSVPGYVYDSESSCTIVKDGPGAEDITKNVMYVYYTEETLKIFFVAVGPGSVNPTELSLKFESDKTATADAIPDTYAKFVGWYYDEACTNPIVVSETMVPDGTHLILKRGDGWAAGTTYFAKFEPGKANLTIRRENAEEGQVYVYQIKNNVTGDTICVTVVGNGQTTVWDLPMGDYTVTQQDSWSWRYNDPSQTFSHEDEAGTTRTFNGDPDKHQWLNGNSPVEKNEGGKAE